MKQDLARIEQFLDALWLEKNLAENTLNAYRRDLSMMVEWLHHRGLTLATAQSDDLQALLAERLEGGYKATSSARLLSAADCSSIFIAKSFVKTIPVRISLHRNCHSVCQKI